MAQWVRLCGLAEAPAEGQVAEMEAGGRTLCVARVGGQLSVLDNVCPHRDGPLGQGWIENGAVVCPWHSWIFNLQTGVSEYPEGHSVEVFACRVEQDQVSVEMP